jgi:HEAT repeat protein
MMHRPLLAALTLALACAAVPEPGDEPAEQARTPVAGDMSDEPSIDDWQDWLRGAVAAAERDHPAAVAELRALAPAATRDGRPRFGSAALDRPEAAVVLLDRLSREPDPQLRAALADAVARTRGPHAAALVGMFPHEPDPQVRIAMVGALRRAAPEPALAGLRLALADADPSVRTVAAETASRRPDGDALADELIKALADRAPSVQIAATRSLGALQVTAAFPALTSHLSHESAELRLHAVRALGRIDPDRAADLPELARLAADPDPRVAAAAADLRARAR